jgi:energy-coupling factor transporter ATP-binding protein EcfA2
MGTKKERKNMVQFQKAIKEKIWLKILMAGPSGSGKSYSALRVARGIAKKAGGRVAVIDTENGRIRYYANEFDFDDVQLSEPYTPESYIDAINMATEDGYSVLIIDSLTHEWSWCLDQIEKIPGTNSYTKWAKITPRHDKLKEKILQAPIHIIATVRGKDAYVLEQDKNGKQIPKKVGLGYTQRDGLEFEYTVTFNIDQSTHSSDATKDNTHLLEGRYDVLTEKDGEALYDWANNGEIRKPTIEEVLQPLQKEVTDMAISLGGSKNKDVVEILKKYSITDPKKCIDKEKLNNALSELKNVEK